MVTFGEWRSACCLACVWSPVPALRFPLRLLRPQPAPVGPEAWSQWLGAEAWAASACCCGAGLLAGRALAQQLQPGAAACWAQPGMLRRWEAAAAAGTAPPGAAARRAGWRTASDAASAGLSAGRSRARTAACNPSQYSSGRRT